MNEDEAFIRAILDTPGDDTARLVYADWLDDRADPRGPYLRAECEWATPWRGGERPADSPHLRELARGLDPVWIARVSRPPMGVCCEHIRFTECGPRLSGADVDRVQRILGVQVPETYRAFLLNYNAGLLTPSELPPRDRPSECDPVFYFYPVGHTLRTAFESAFALESVGPLRSPAVLMPLASSDADLEAWFLGVSGVFRGKLYSEDTVKAYRLREGQPINPDGPSLPELLRDLTPRWESARTQKYDI